MKSEIQNRQNLLFEKVLLKYDIDFATFTELHSVRNEIEARF